MKIPDREAQRADLPKGFLNRNGKNRKQGAFLGTV